MSRPDPLRGSYTVVRTEGSSMFPLIRAGSEVGIADVEPEKIECGDIISFRKDGRTYVHRAIAKRWENGRLLIREKGDNQANSSWIRADEINGKAVWVSSNGRTRRLAGPSSRLPVRILTTLSLAEASILDGLKSVLPAGGPRFCRFKRDLAGIRRLAFMPLKIFFLPVLFSAYRPLRPDDTGPETGFLLGCMRHALKKEGGAAPGPPKDLDWPLALKAAGWHGLIPLLADEMEDVIPPELLPEIKKIRARTAMTNISALGTAAAVDGILRRAGVPYALLKGPLLSKTVYPEGSGRVFCDVDVLVRRRDRDRAVAALEGESWRCASGKLMRRLLGFGHFHLAFHPEGAGGLTVELHWGLVDRANLFRIGEEEIFSRIADIEIGGTAFSAMAPEDGFIYLCLHAAKHGLFNRLGLISGEPPEWFCRPDMGNRLTWFMDIELFLGKWREHMSWEDIRQRSARWNVTGEIIDTLEVADLLMPGSQAALALSEMGRQAGERPSGRGLLAARLLRAGPIRLMLERSMKMDSNLLFRPARLFLLSGVIIPSPARLRRYYGLESPLLIPFYYAVHPFNMIRKLF